MGPENTTNNEPMREIPQVKEERSIGPAVGIIVIIAVIVIGGLYFWGQRIERGKALPVQTTQTEPITTGETNQSSELDATVQAMQTQSSSDDVSSIEADLNSTDLSSLGSEANDVNTAATVGTTP